MMLSPPCCASAIVADVYGAMIKSVAILLAFVATLALTRYAYMLQRYCLRLLARAIAMLRYCAIVADASFRLCRQPRFSPLR